MYYANDIFLVYGFEVLVHIMFIIYNSLVWTTDAEVNGNKSSGSGFVGFIFSNDFFIYFKEKVWIKDVYIHIYIFTS